jgi:transposase InsO family protein
VTTFCAEHGISRKTFYAIWKRVKDEGPAAALEPRTRRPHHSPNKIGDDVKQHALDVRAALERSGLDHGPISVFEKMRSLGMPAPSEASLARIFREKGVARLEPNKKPRAAYRRFVYPAPNACWQLDATEYVLTGGRKCVIFQLEDDHSRVEVASHVARGETSEAAVAVMAKGIAARGVPQRLLTDNGSALNPTRRGWESELVTYVTSLGVEAITGRPGRPTTQGKNERLHQTLFKWLDKQPLAKTIAELQTLVDAFDVIYNTERPHQSLPGRMKPQQAWDATPVAEPPRPQPDRPGPAAPAQQTPAARIRHGAYGDELRTVHASGYVKLLGIRFRIGAAHAGAAVHVAWDPESIQFFDTDGTLLIAHRWPQPGSTYVGHPKPAATPHDPATVTDVLTHELSPMS